MSNKPQESNLNPTVEDVLGNMVIEPPDNGEANERPEDRASPSSTETSEDEKSETGSTETALTEDEVMQERFGTIVHGDTHFVIDFKGASTRQRRDGFNRITDRSKDSSRDEIQTLVTASGFEIVALHSRASSCSMSLLCGSSIVEGRLFSRKTTLTRSQDASDLESGLVRSRNAQVPTTILPRFYAVGI
jgi:hypothetical protein